MLPGAFQDFNSAEVALDAIHITAELGIAGLLAVLVQDAACLQSIPAAAIAPHLLCLRLDLKTLSGVQDQCCAWEECIYKVDVEKRKF